MGGALFYQVGVPLQSRALILLPAWSLLRVPTQTLGERAWCGGAQAVRQGLPEGFGRDWLASVLTATTF